VVESIDQGPGAVVAAAAVVVAAALRDALARVAAAGGAAAVARVGARSRCARCHPRARRSGGRDPQAHNAAAAGWRPSRPQRLPRSEEAGKVARARAEAAAAAARRGVVAGAGLGAAWSGWPLR
jgi:hypothetical protein